MTSRELVYKTLNFENPERVPRQKWVLPWAQHHYPVELNQIGEDYPDDIIGAPGYNKVNDRSEGDPTEVGESTDAWGCKFLNYQKGIIGEVKEPLVKDDAWKDVNNVHIPREWLTIDIDKINAFCKNTDKFVMAGACPRPFEQLQFIRGTENLFIDLMLRPQGLLDFMKKMHAFNCEQLTLWASTDVDALSFMDDWGSQNSLLINPKVWVEFFKPMYKDYIDIAHDHGKKIFMHSDGYILDIYPHLIELGLDAINSQLFCMPMEELAKYKGKITFWGEIDRQQLLPYGSLEDIKHAVQQVKNNLWARGGCIAQCEFGPGAKPANVEKVFETWNLCL
ncbi:methyltransferase [Vallitalea pronyensis]|uniref:Methyltransferase n=1 Tax=Vallitalea pronyensis TaxID=1348613 RepID=A0A8J8SJE1_9FIRM|nr:uroporphyrinogen decarboxylase family protein [Vallitalea pronyensis]QUI25468.1 methyltransferase [Vallitalea pronyensis]